MKSIRIGLLGLGTVGQAVARALLERKDHLGHAIGAEPVLHCASVRDPGRPRSLAPSRLVEPMELVRSPEVDLVVELMGGEEPARTLIAAALESSKNVVTANKRVMALHGTALSKLAASHGVELRYEAAVGGGIPLVAPLENDLLANRILELRAIINGTTNYILTRMFEGASFKEALSHAQSMGFAEADPRDDVDAVDAADKIVILARLAFGLECSPAEIYREGIRGIDSKDIGYGRELGYVLKLVATARRASGGVDARVHPEFLPATHPLARVDGAQNAVHLTGDLCGPVMFSGLGAGGDATASAVLADLCRIGRRLVLKEPAPEPRSPKIAPNLCPIAQVRTRCYFRLEVEDSPGVFAQVTQTLAQHQIGLASVIQRDPGLLGSAEVVLLTYSALESALSSAERDLKNLSSVRAVRARIRVDAPDARGARG